MQKRIATALGFLGCILALLGYAACIDTVSAEQGLRVWIAQTITEAGMVAVIGGVLGMAIGFCLERDSNGFADVLRMQSRARWRRRRNRPRSIFWVAIHFLKKRAWRPRSSKQLSMAGTKKNGRGI